MTMTRLVNCHLSPIVVIALQEAFHSELFATRSGRGEAVTHNRDVDPLSVTKGHDKIACQATAGDRSVCGLADVWGWSARLANERPTSTLLRQRGARSARSASGGTRGQVQGCLQENATNTYCVFWRRVLFASLHFFQRAVAFKERRPYTHESLAELLTTLSADYDNLILYHERRVGIGPMTRPATWFSHQGANAK
jgi:hypothetical protein